MTKKINLKRTSEDKIVHNLRMLGFDAIKVTTGKKTRWLLRAVDDDTTYVSLSVEFLRKMNESKWRRLKLAEQEVRVFEQKKARK